jgi:hypothetical protein
MSAGNPVAIAEQLLELVKSISEPQVDPLKVYNTKIEIQNACDSLLIKLLGPLEYTVLVAGASTCNYCLFFIANNNLPVSNRILPRVGIPSLCHQPRYRRFDWRWPEHPP